MNQIETFFDTMRNAGTLSAYMIRKKSGRYWIVPTCGGTLASSMSVAARGYWKVTCCRTNPRQIVAIDIAGQMIEKARVKYPDHPLIEFLQEDAMSYKGERIRLYYPV